MLYYCQEFSFTRLNLDQYLKMHVKLAREICCMHPALVSLSPRGEKLSSATQDSPTVSSTGIHLGPGPPRFEAEDFIN